MPGALILTGVTAGMAAGFASGLLGVTPGQAATVLAPFH
jgi:hypothetical protein